MSRFVYAFAFLLLASTVSAAHVNGTLTIYPDVQDCSANATSVVLPNVTFGACNSYAVVNTLFNFTAICSSRPGVLTIKFYSTSGCNDTAEITGATFVSEASGPKCNAVANNTLGNSNPASILVPSCNPPAATSAPTNATNPSNSPTATPTPTPTVPSNATQPPRNVAAQASVSASLMAAAVAVIVMTLF